MSSELGPHSPAATQDTASSSPVKSNADTATRPASTSPPTEDGAAVTSGSRAGSSAKSPSLNPTPSARSSRIEQDTDVSLSSLLDQGFSPELSEALDKLNSLFKAAAENSGTAPDSLKASAESIIDTQRARLEDRKAREAAASQSNGGLKVPAPSASPIARDGPAGGAGL
ncbi:hypothetical protein IAT40_003282 [Kwoniella sp. CBS 6097]